MWLGQRKFVVDLVATKRLEFDSFKIGFFFG